MSHEMPEGTRTVFSYLKKCASQRRTVFYGEIAKTAKLANQGVAGPLHYIQDHCWRRGLPPLTAIAVYKSTRLPGNGFRPNGKKKVTEKEWQEMVREVFEFDWSEIKLQNPRRRSADGFFEIADKLAAAKFPPMTMEEIQKEVKAVRSQEPASAGTIPALTPLSLDEARSLRGSGWEGDLDDMRTRSDGIITTSHDWLAKS